MKANVERKEEEKTKTDEQKSGETEVDGFF